MRLFPDWVSVAAISYLAAPVLVFFLGWLQPLAGTLLAGLLAYALYCLCLRLPERPAKYTAGALAWMLLIAFAWSAFGGAGHLFYANLDWRTRDAVYADLILAAWPPAYGWDDGVALIMRTAMGFFLPPAVAAKLVGIEFAPALLLAWCTLGVYLFLLLLPLPGRFGLRLVFVSLLVVFFSGMDYPGILVAHGQTPMFPLPLEWWRPWTYTSLTAQLLWAPNHALPLWLGSALLCCHKDARSLPALALVGLPMLLLWTPFAVIGLLPWFAWALWRNFDSPAAAVRATEKVQWLAATLTTVVLVGILSRPGSSAINVQLGASAGSTPTGVATWPLPALVMAYIQFAAFEFGVLALLLRPTHPAARQSLGGAVGLLLILPLMRFGPSNDWMLRVSTPCLVILLILVLAEFERPWAEIRRSARLVGLATIMMLGAVTPFFELARAVAWQRTPPNFGQSLAAQQGYLPPHYIGRLDLPMLQTLLKPPSPVPEGIQRQSLLRDPAPRLPW
ncbi:MAG: hypothetical protein Q8S20_15410 [Sulfuritalea sp.]|nr:hypothetical protein [Sulfuritalea sp.]